MATAQTDQITEKSIQTDGVVIPWATFYDPLVKLMTLGQASRLRRRTVAVAAVRAGTHVLDVGCGTGDLTVAAWQKVQGLAEIHRVLRPGGHLVVVDFKGPTSRFAKGLMTLMLHGAQQTGIQDLLPLLTAAAFTPTASGGIILPTLGYLRAQKAEAHVR